MPRNINLQTPRLILREYKPEDLAGVHEYACDPETVKFMTWGPNEIADTENFIQLAISQQIVTPRLNYHFTVILEKQGYIIGGCGIHIRNPIQNTAEIGYCFNKKFWGNGYATETVNRLLRFGFDELYLHRIIATCDTRNIASAKVLMNNFMRKEAHFIQHIWLRNEWRDSFLYAILDNEWSRTSNKKTE